MSIGYGAITLRLMLAAILGGLIGLERESVSRPAGFRTHILVAIGSALIMMVSAYALSDSMTERYDPGRIAAQVVSGIGFLGAGTIMRQGVTVQGLTTAASLWIVAGIGLAVGSGFYYPAIFVTLLAALTLLFLGKIGWNRRLSRHQIMSVVMQDMPGQLALVFTVLGQFHINVLNIDLSPLEDGDTKLNLKVELPPKTNKTNILSELGSLPGIKSASFGD